MTPPGEGAEVHDATAFVRRAMPLCDTLGVRAVAAGRDVVELELDWDASLCTTGGILHGGVVMALADSAGALCAYLNLPEGATTSTIESKTNFFAPVPGGALRASSRPLHVGSTTVVVETDVVRDDGRRVARVIQTQAVLRPQV